MFVRFAALALALAPAPSALAQAERDPSELELKTERVVVFKDGYALIVKSARAIPDENGVVYTEDVPDSAALGSFWATFAAEIPAGARIAGMRAEWIEQTLEPGDPVGCRSMRELFEANVGRAVRLQLRAAEEPEIAGTIVQVLEAAGLVVLERRTPAARSPGGRIALPIADVRSLVAADLVTTVEPAPGSVRKKRLSIDLTLGDGPLHATAPVELRILYFTPGLRWIPTYRLSGELVDSCDLALQAELLNELEDIDDAEFDLVVGVPNFRFGSVISPLSLERTMRDSLAQAAPQLMGRANALSNALFSQRSMEHRGGAMAGPQPASTTSVGDIAPGLGATGEHDLFVYSAGRRSLKKGARATINLWELDVPLAHLYTLDLDIVRGSNHEPWIRDRDTSRTSPLRLAKNPVWHQLRLANGSPFPWTTGPALLLRGLLPLGQELLTYTPKGGSVLVPVTVAVDVQGRFREEQLEREENAYRRNNHDYDKLTKRLQVTLTNFREEVADVRIQVALGGQVTRASDGADVLLDEPSSADWENRNLFDHALNPHSQVTWELELAPGESRTVDFDLVLFVR